jgi:hypothetical protein
MRMHREKLTAMHEAQEALLTIRKIHLHEAFRVLNEKRHVLSQERPFHENAYEFDDDEDVAEEHRHVLARLAALKKTLSQLPPLPPVSDSAAADVANQGEKMDDSSDAMDVNI